MLVQRIEYTPNGTRVPLDPDVLARARRNSRIYEVTADRGAYHYLRIAERTERAARARFAEFGAQVMSLPGYVGLQAADIDTRSNPDPLRRHVGVEIVYLLELPVAERLPAPATRRAGTVDLLAYHR